MKNKIKIKKEKKISTVLIWQIVSKFLIQGLAFFTAPIFTRLLSPEEYGQLSVFHTWVAFSGILVGFQSHQSIPVARIKFNNSKEFNQYLFNALFISFLSFVIIFQPFFFLRKWIGEILEFPSYLIPIIILNAFFSYCIGFYSCKLIQFKQIGRNTIISLTSAISTVLLSLLFIFSLNKQRYISKIYAETLVTCLFGSFFLIIICIKGGFRFNKSYFTFCMSFSLPLILHGAGGIIFTQSDRVMLQKMIGPGESGIYSIIYTFSLAIDLIKQSFSSVWEPFYYDYKKTGVKDIREKASVYLKVFVVLTSGFILLAPEVFKLMVPNNYWSGIKIIPIISVAYFFNFMYTFPSLYEFYRKKTASIAIISLSCAFLNIGLNFILIPKAGAIGAAFATLITYFIAFLLHALNVKFVLKPNDYDYDTWFYIKGIIPILIVTFIFFITMDLWFFRWGLGVILGVYLVIILIKNKTWIPINNINIKNGEMK